MPRIELHIQSDKASNTGWELGLIPEVIPIDEFDTDLTAAL
jgi:hypothetical protein